MTKKSEFDIKLARLNYKMPVIASSNVAGLNKLSFTPTKYKQVEKMTIWQKLENASQAFTTDGIVQNIFLTQVAMGMKKFEHKIVGDKNGKHKKVFDDVARRLRLDSFLRWFYLASLIYSNVYMVEFWQERRYTWGTSTRMLDVPVGLTLIDPMNGRILGSSLDPDSKGIGIKVEQNSMDDYSEDKIKEINSQFKNNIFDGKVTTNEIVKYMRRSGNRPGDVVIKFNEEAVSHFKPTGFDWERYGNPKLTGCLTDIQLKRKLQEADFAVSDGIINALYVYKVGNDEYPMQDQEDVALSNLLKSPSRTFGLVWNHRLEVEIISPKSDVMTSPERYDKVNDAIKEALGFTFGLVGIKGRRDVDKFVKMFADVVDAERSDIARHFEERIYRRIMKKNGLDTYPSIKFNKIGVSMSDVAKTIVGMFYDRGLISRQSALDVEDYDYEEEKERRVVEQKDSEVFTPPELPFSKSIGMNFDDLMEKVVKPALDNIVKEKGLVREEE